MQGEWHPIETKALQSRIAEIYKSDMNWFTEIEDF